MSRYLSVWSLRHSLLAHLGTCNPHFNKSAYFETFGKLKTNLDRVNFVYNDIKKFNLFPNAVNKSKGKQDLKSQTLWEKGNEAFGEGGYREALDLYSSSVSTAKNAETLALAYASRSASLYKLGRYQDCLVDIERALVNNYPENLKPQLVTRRNKAELMLNSSKPLERYHQDIPEIALSEKHPTIPSAKNCIKIETNEDFGKHIVATRDIEIGEIICIEKPYASCVVSDPMLRCHTCLELCYNPIPCDNCTRLVFCSENCKNQANNTFHKYECSILEFLSDCKIRCNTDSLAVRVAASMVAALARDSSEMTQEKIYRSDRYEGISNLMKKFKVEDLHQQAVTAACIFHVFLNQTSFFNNCPNNHIIKNRFKEIVLSQILISRWNSWAIYESTLFLFERVEEEFGIGLYSLVSLFNHSCSPNVVRIYYGSTIVLRTIGSIKKGQQCFVTYGLTYWNRNRSYRRLSLKHKVGSV